MQIVAVIHSSGKLFREETLVNCFREDNSCNHNKLKKAMDDLCDLVHTSIYEYDKNMLKQFNL